MARSCARRVRRACPGLDGAHATWTTSMFGDQRGRFSLRAGQLAQRAHAVPVGGIGGKRGIHGRNYIRGISNSMPRSITGRKPRVACPLACVVPLVWFQSARRHSPAHREYVDRLLCLENRKAKAQTVDCNRGRTRSASDIGRSRFYHPVSQALSCCN